MMTSSSRRRIGALAGSAALLAGVGIAGAVVPARAAATAPAAQSDDSGSSCHLGNGIKHVVQLTFDNVHFFRDNPNVPSDLEMMPNLLHFFENNGTFLGEADLGFSDSIPEGLYGSQFASAGWRLTFKPTKFHVNTYLMFAYARSAVSGKEDVAVRYFAIHD